MNNPRVNRYLKDKAMDHMDHALGRPVDPMGETYRNHFATGADGKDAKQFAASPNWEKLGRRDDMAFFAVTDAGRRALKDHLKAIGDPWQPYSVTWGGHTVVIAAKSIGNAKYSTYLDVSDSYSELKFVDFAREAKVRRVAA
ncbi:hypothetical protein CN233_32340 [Sinorhizobium meliloti]|uniref:hypothetical protein n=1 Tax=Rhizobium meliloti TaxID=382 RepID=UPI000FD79692|nr:hypothetical protein [Sinorhizobium meliloti]RVG22149.1 hypothetical protein CN233_32340 [Sinorhizobium meliloti]RVI03691.1 hypothetical protein CN205_22605 [Sinorhizobium meliloti]RVK97500.1 hypothetical protein CN150_10560 [Sinorhizobium meliloti]RVK98722.1 hypothetical protein CN152_15555 [Sinorhizobium meliloti]RVN42257.1 hypothetical protein CN113_23955 [Sinorhizobium meliloti]